MAKPIIKKLGREYFKTVATMLTSAFGLVAALAWNDLIKRIIDHYISPGSGVISQLLYAVLVTIIVVLVTLELGRIAQKVDDKE